MFESIRYHAGRINDGVGGQEVYVSIGETHHGRLYHHVRHSPDGFNWGYEGSGAADLALSILIDFFERTVPPYCEEPACFDKAWSLHQIFKCDFVATWGAEWQVTGAEIQAWLDGRTDEEEHIKKLMGGE